MSRYPLLEYLAISSEMESLRGNLSIEFKWVDYIVRCSNRQSSVCVGGDVCLMGPLMSVMFERVIHARP